MTSTTENAATTTVNAAAAAQGTHVAPKPATTKKTTAPKTGATKASKGAKKAAAKKQAKPAAKPKTKSADAKVSAAGRANSKKAAVLDLLRRKGGATTGEIAKATGWQNHSIRGFISGTVGKKMGLTVESTRNEQGERYYRIAK